MGTTYPTRVVKGLGWQDGDQLRLEVSARKRLVELNRTAAVILHLCDGIRSEREIIRLLEQAYATVATDSLTAEVRECLVVLEERGLIRQSATRAEAVPVIRVRFTDFWPGFDPAANCFTRLLSRWCLVLLVEDGGTDLLFQSVYQSGGSQAAVPAEECLAVLVSDGPDPPDTASFDFFFTPHDVDPALRDRRCRVPAGEQLRSGDFAFDREDCDRFREFLFPFDAEHQLELCREALAANPSDATLLALQAALVTRLSGWERSLGYWIAYRNRPAMDAPARRGRVRWPPSSRPSIGYDVLTIDHPPGLPERRRHVCIYTALFGSYDTLSPIYGQGSGVDYICFTDQQLDVAGWTIVRSERRYPNPVLCAKEFKVLPHRFLASHDASLYVDASTFIFHDLAPLIDRFLRDERFVMYRHPARHDAYDDAEAILIGHRHLPAPIVRQISHYDSEGMPAGAGLFEASFIWRDHNDRDVVALMELWWREIKAWSTRDQLSLSYLIWKTGIRPKILPPQFGTSRINPYFLKRPHQTDTRLRIALPRHVPLTILYHPRHRDVASTRMRGEQLASLVADRAGPELEVRYDSDTGVSRSFLILTKGMLKEISPYALMRLRQRNLLVAADYVDEKPRPDLESYIDVYIASSIMGYYRLSHRFTDRPVFLVSHHVDPRLPPRHDVPRMFRVGYFGEPGNALHRELMADVVDFHFLDTRRSSTDWMDHVTGYCLHYAVRSARTFDGDKPFLKGFTAARCQSNIVVGRHDGDAMYYLPPDYPFFVDGDRPEDVRRVIAKAAGAFNGPEWAYGLRAMEIVRARSSDERVYAEFAHMMDRLRES